MFLSLYFSVFYMYFTLLFYDAKIRRKIESTKNKFLHMDKNKELWITFRQIFSSS